MFSKQAQINGRCQSQQSLVGADIGGGSITADMLFPGGQGEYICSLAAIINRFTSQATCHLAHIFLAGGKQAQVGSTIGEGDTQ